MAMRSPITSIVPAPAEERKRIQNCFIPGGMMSEGNLGEDGNPRNGSE